MTFGGVPLAPSRIPAPPGEPYRLPIHTTHSIVSPYDSIDLSRVSQVNMIQY
jgi:hypothetical protein